MNKMELLNAKLAAQIKVKSVLQRVAQELMPEEMNNGKPVSANVGGVPQPVSDTSGNLPDGNNPE
jgi:hypothetical protein